MHTHRRSTAPRYRLSALICAGEGVPHFYLLGILDGGHRRVLHWAQLGEPRPPRRSAPKVEKHFGTVATCNIYLQIIPPLFLLAIYSISQSTHRPAYYCLLLPAILPATLLAIPILGLRTAELLQLIVLRPFHLDLLAAFAIRQDVQQSQVLHVSQGIIGTFAAPPMECE